MDRNKLLRIKSILEELGKANEDLELMMDMLNVTESEKNRILDAIILTNEKLLEIRRSNISELENHVKIEDL